MKHAIDTGQPLDRYIDRFLFADGWRVSSVVLVDDTSLYEVTITKTAGPDEGRTVTRRATSAGEATFMACSTARQVLADASQRV
jgi:hypothetical protein